MVPQLNMAPMRKPTEPQTRKPMIINDVWSMNTSQSSKIINSPTGITADIMVKSLNTHANTAHITVTTLNSITFMRVLNLSSLMMLSSEW